MKILYTIGHSNHSLKQFIELISTYGITQIIDIRSIPKSKHVPWFNARRIASELSKKKISYIQIPELGGLRHTSKDSINQGWINSSFRGYADYMQTAEFFKGIKLLNQLIKRSRYHSAVMCAEALPWRCHRSLVADAEVIRGVKVIHIISKTSRLDHTLTSFAKINRTKRPMRVFYPNSGK